jgi:hypothetical protein
MPEEIQKEKRIKRIVAAIDCANQKGLCSMEEPREGGNPKHGLVRFDFPRPLAALDNESSQSGSPYQFLSS